MANVTSKSGKNKDELMLDIQGLQTHFFTEDGVIKAVDGVDIFVKKGETLGIVGESGCGKSVTSLSVMRLVGQPGKIVGGKIFFDGTNLLDLPEKDMTKIRGNRISMIFQQPTTCLNPVFKIGDQIAEVLNIHQDLGKEAGWNRAIELLRMVGIPEPAKRANAYPHEISGGQAQRVMIAMALACAPELLIADEPTTALDVTIQAQILDLMRDLRSKTGTSIMLITHDMGVVAEMCDRVVVMYAGQIVEQADVKTLFARPMHPYTKGLLGSIPVLGEIREKLDVIPGSVPNLLTPPPACRFEPRCEICQGHAREMCQTQMPQLKEVEPGHWVRSWLYD
ncbi:MAG TPA: ABC transporter ATP-binding protein [Thermoflexales bacterium]|mgnify:CR=1 FL=1|nr:ABC transporter ATP-binding protein [Thermoflexales bacterium]HQW33836.1 ABC transporter ATP-binding protein [Thermoflexales bacterium]HQZ21478.1 ABC transporter ATP-binding protein [Thermoflexales bacterium]